MGNRISLLPDEILCHILSFVPTKVAVATSVLSKRWKPLWRSVPALDFYYRDYYSVTKDKARFGFVQCVSTFILSRDLNQPLRKFRIRCCSSVFDSAFFNAWLNAWLTTAAQSRVEHIDLCMYVEIIVLPSILLTCRTLVVFKLTCLEMSGLSSVHLPSLKILHLNNVKFLEHTHLAVFLCGTPNLEDLETKGVRFLHYETEGIFRRLPKLLRAVIVKDAVPLDVLYNVQFLRIEKMEDDVDIEDQIPKFHNLTHIELCYFDYTRYWFDVFAILECCPKLQNLSIEMEYWNLDAPERGLKEDWSCPPRVPKCISFHLKSCCLNNYSGTAGEFEFAKYILQNARVLRDMTICTWEDEAEKKKLEMIKELSLCRRISSTCKLSFN